MSDDDRPKLTRAEAFEKMRNIVAAIHDNDPGSVTEDTHISDDTADAIFDRMLNEGWYPHHARVSSTSDYTIGKMLDDLDFP